MNDWSDFGAVLRDTRTRFGWSLQDVAHRTRIPVFTLRQLEANEYSGFPSRAYAKSFLSQYAEHLGIDATEWLDRFETGDALSNLDAYEYLKDHDERLEASSVSPRSTPSRKKVKPAKEKPGRERSRPGMSATALQPLVLFLITAAVVTAAVFGFMKLSESLSEDTAATRENHPAPEALRPLTGIPQSRSTPRDLSAVPRALPVNSDPDLDGGIPGSTNGTENLSSTPTTQQAPPIELVSEPAPAPARAVIVEE